MLSPRKVYFNSKSSILIPMVLILQIVVDYFDYSFDLIRKISFNSLALCELFIVERNYAPLINLEVDKNLVFNRNWTATFFSKFLINSEWWDTFV